MQQEVKYFGGGLNTDDALVNFPELDYVNAQNLRFTRSDDIGSAVAGFGMNLINDQSSTYTCMGSYADSANRNIYYFLNHRFGNHQLRVYNIDNGSDRLVLSNSQVSGGGLNITAKITGIGMVGNVLYWTDNTYEPRRLDVVRQLNGEYTGLIEQDILLLRRPPLLPLSVAFVRSNEFPEIPDQVTNLLRNNCFQFCYRYVYQNGEVSPLSSYSKLIRYDNDDDDTWNYDAVTITIPQAEQIPKLVVKVQFAVRKTNSGNWYLFEEVADVNLFIQHNNSDDQVATFFLNTKAGVAISPEETARYFDNIPIKSKCLEVARNRIFLGNNTFGYGLESGVDLELNPIYKTVESGATPYLNGKYWVVFIQCAGSLGGINPFNKKKYNTVLVRVTSADPLVAGYYITGLSYSKNGYPEEITISPNALLILDTDVSDFRDIVDAYYEYIGSPCQGRGGIADATALEYTPQTPKVYGLGSTSGFGSDNLQLWKLNSSYQFGLVFLDHGGRTSGVLTNKNWTVSTPIRKFSQDTYISEVEYKLRYSTFIPTWAVAVQIVRTKSATHDFFFQTFSPEVKYVNKDSDGTLTYVDTYDANLTIAIAWSLERLNGDGLGYQYKEGDILFAANSDDSGAMNLAITDTQGKYVFTKARDLGELDLSNPWSVALIEVYTPRKVDFNELFYEIGEVVQIINPGQSTRTFGNDMGLLMGDVWMKMRETGAGDIGVEVMSLNDLRWKDWSQDTGRGWLVPVAASNTRPNSIVYSGVYQQQSAINGLSTFLVLDQEEVEQRNGAINKLIYSSSGNDYGNVMLAICENETASIYLGQTQVLDDAGNTILATTGKVIGSVNNLHGGFGTINAESVAEKDGMVFYFDALKGKVIRYDTNGLFPISDYKMSEYFRNLGMRVRKTGARVMGTIDPITDEYLLSFPQMAPETAPEYIIDRPELIYESTIGQGTYPLPDLQGSFHYRITVLSLEPGEGIRLTAGTTVLWETVETGAFIFYIPTLKTAQIVSEGLCSFTLEVFPNRYDKIDDGAAKTMVFSEQMKRWQPSLAFNPDWGSYVNNALVFFKLGGIWRVTEDSPNSFFGVQHQAGIVYVSNANFPTVKRWMTIQVRGECPELVYLYADGRTDLEAAEFVDRESVWSAGVLRDKFTPGLTYEQGLIVGATVKGLAGTVHVSWPVGTRNLFSTMNFKYLASLGNV